MPDIHVRQVYLAASNFERHCEFVAETLGLALQFRDGDRWAQFSAGGISLAVASADESAGVAPGTWVPVVAVEDLEATLEAVAAAGGSHADVRDMGDHGRTCLVTDRDGASYSLFAR